MPENDRPDFTKKMYLPDIVSPAEQTSLDAQVKIQLAKTIESMISHLINDENLKRRVQTIYGRISADPSKVDDSIRLMLQFEIADAIKKTTEHIASVRGIQMNEIFALAVPIVATITTQALTSGSIIKSLAESVEELKEKLKLVNPIPRYTAKYLQDNLSSFIKEAHDRNLSFSMMAVKLQEKSTRLGLSAENRLISFMEMVLKRKRSPGDNIELISMENGFFILLFINTTTRTACVCAWELDEEIKRSFDQQFSIALASYDPEVFKKTQPQQHSLMQVHRQLPALYGLTLLKMLEHGIKLGESLPTDKPGIIFQLKKILTPQSFERGGTQYILEKGDPEFASILGSINNPRSKPLDIKAESIETPISIPQVPSTIRTVHFPEDNCGIETEPIIQRREVPLRGLRAIDQPKKDEKK